MPEFDPRELRRQVRAVVDGEKDYRLVERVVVAHREAGVPDEVLLEALGDLVGELGDEGRDDDDQELVLGAMDHLTGW